jgi:HEXXH motif-containing protein
MRLSLADSLVHIRDQVRGQVHFDEDALTRMIEAMKAGARYPLSTFGIYSETVIALIDGDDPGQCRQLLADLVQERPVLSPVEGPVGPEWRVLPLDAPAHAPYRDLYQRLMNGAPNASFRIVPPAPALAASYSERLLRSFKLLEEAIPELAGEFNALVSDVIMVAGDAQAKYQFDGGSGYMLWGGLFLNATSHPDEVTMIEVMAHESAHILLYACAADEALVENDDEELFASPLRADPRPMDGIYHATFVSARMYWTLSRLLESGRLGENARFTAEAARRSDEQNFWSGHGVVAQHGRLTATGRDVMDAAHAYMESVR